MSLITNYLQTRMPLMLWVGIKLGAMLLVYCRLVGDDCVDGDEDGGCAEGYGQQCYKPFCCRGE